MTWRIAVALAAGIVCAAGFGLPTRGSEGPSDRALSTTLADLGAAGRESCSRAIDELPLDRMDPACRQEIEHFHRSTTIHRRLPDDRRSPTAPPRGPPDVRRGLGGFPGWTIRPPATKLFGSFPGFDHGSRGTESCGDRSARSQVVPGRDGVPGAGVNDPFAHDHVAVRPPRCST